jgi:hypothetical protein
VAHDLHDGAPFGERVRRPSWGSGRSSSRSPGVC